MTSGHPVGSLASILDIETQPEAVVRSQAYLPEDVLWISCWISWLPVASGYFDFTRASAPATIGAASDVPVRLWPGLPAAARHPAGCP